MEMLNVAFGKSSMYKTSGTNVSKRAVKTLKMMSALDAPSTSRIDENIEKVKKIIMDKRRIAVREVADYVGISFGSH